MNAGETPRKVFTAQNPAQAHLVRLLLARHGIPAEVTQEELFTARGEVPPTMGTLPAVVVRRAEDAPRAQEIVQDADQRRAAGSGSACPLCGSGDLHDSSGLISILVLFLVFSGCVGTAVLLLALGFTENLAALLALLLVSLAACAGAGAFLLKESRSRRRYYQCLDCGLKWSLVPGEEGSFSTRGGRAGRL